MHVVRMLTTNAYAKIRMIHVASICAMQIELKVVQTMVLTTRVIAKKGMRKRTVTNVLKTIM